jgi:hypothetical protein
VFIRERVSFTFSKAQDGSWQLWLSADVQEKTWCAGFKLEAAEVAICSNKVLLGATVVELGEVFTARRRSIRTGRSVCCLSGVGTSKGDLRGSTNGCLWDGCLWDAPVEMEVWRKAVTEGSWNGRPVPLIVVGGDEQFRMKWALGAGRRPLVMSGQWNMKNYFEGLSHVVLDEVDFRNFGSGKVQYWREVLGCQEFVDVHDRYTRTKCIKWGLPVVVLCSAESDPRLVPSIAEYLLFAPCVIVSLVDLNIST